MFVPSVLHCMSSCSECFESVDRYPFEPSFLQTSQVREKMPARSHTEFGCSRLLVRSALGLNLPMRPRMRFSSNPERIFLATFWSIVVASQIAFHSFEKWTDMMMRYFAKFVLLHEWVHAYMQTYNAYNANKTQHTQTYTRTRKHA